MEHGRCNSSTRLTKQCSFYGAYHDSKHKKHKTHAPFFCLLQQQAGLQIGLLPVHKNKNAFNLNITFKNEKYVVDEEQSKLGITFNANNSLQSFKSYGYVSSEEKLRKLVKKTKNNLSQVRSLLKVESVRVF